MKTKARQKINNIINKTNSQEAYTFIQLGGPIVIFLKISVIF